MMESKPHSWVLHFQLRSSKKTSMPDDSRLKRLFEQCVEQHADSMYRVAFRLTGCRELASELVQDTYLNAWKNIGSLNDVDKMKSWMFAIMRNQYTKLLRQLPKSRQMTELVIENLGVPAETNDYQSDQQLVQAALQQLNDDHKLPLLLVSMEGMTVDQAATVLELPRGTILSRLHRGRKKLKSILNGLNPNWSGTVSAPRQGDLS